MASFSMWEEQITFADGWFILSDGKGHHSVISHETARMLERNYQSYQASMDVNRGGADPEIAYPNRGFVMKHSTILYERYHVDNLIVSEVLPIPKELIIPKSINGLPINYIARNAFQGETTIERVVLHEDIQEIGESAFEGCIHLQTLQADNEHLQIKRDAFKDTAMYTEQATLYVHNTLLKVDPSVCGYLHVKEGTTAIADNAAKDCRNITELHLPESVCTIGRSAFEGCDRLQRVHLSTALHTLGENAFSKCTALEAIVFPPIMSEIRAAAFSGCTSLKTVMLPEGITEISSMLFYQCNALSDVRIPDSVRKVWYNAFFESGLFIAYEQSDADELYIGKWLIHYDWKEKTTLCVREGTIGIGGMNWSKPSKLHTVSLPSSLKYIGCEAFVGAPLTEVTLPRGLERIETAAFRETSLRSIHIPASVHEIEQWVFMDCEQLERITFAGAKTKIAASAITGRRDHSPIDITAPVPSTAKAFFDTYGKRYHFTFTPRMPSFFGSLFKNKP